MNITHTDLANAFERINLGNFPTPIQHLPTLSTQTNCNIYIKRDDIANNTYGGNKVRTLEYLLAQAKTQKSKRIITSGGIGSNYIVAVAAHAQQINLKCEAIMINQPLTENVRKNLLLTHHFGATIHHTHGFTGGLIKLIHLYCKHTIQDHKTPYTIRPGGATPEGSLGYALAALELAQQIKNGDCPQPDTIFITIGSCGTIAGLIAGLTLTNLKIPIIGVRVVETYIVNRPHINWLATQTLKKILKQTNHNQKPPKLANYQINHNYFGGLYGQPTTKGNHAMNLAKKKDNITLDPVYTGKCFAALLDWCTQNPTKTTLFWHTYNSQDLSTILQKQDWHQLPQTLWKYFDNTTPLAPAK